MLKFAKKRGVVNIAKWVGVVSIGILALWLDWIDVVTWVAQAHLSTGIPLWKLWGVQIVAHVVAVIILGGVSLWGIHKFREEEED